jgi:hypothetical protein
MTRILHVRKWYVRLEQVRDGEAARQAWHLLVIAQGWSPVGEPSVTHDGATPAVVGGIVEHPGLTVNPDARHVEVVL